MYLYTPTAELSRITVITPAQEHHDASAEYVEPGPLLPRQQPALPAKRAAL
ncbi:hypothetical protein COCNU_07G010650 [Cocos nucifera]|uniref:Uncharacterized protein n=1 Tax=Cocos nucifera TaxID=13894 RepID=A0A8K0IEW4_COCNU|nr:hypothetical protein COCNU_07G000050 [Cocos nucifera]KAG1354953.1 hypothetical protein COCNU_07G010650 [Cocos nucifera]